MENIKVNYMQNWDCNGYHTTQNVTVSENILIRFNDYLNDCRKLIQKKHLYSNEDMKILYYGTDIRRNQKECLHLTQLSLLYQFLIQNHVDCNRLKTDRNTMLIIK